MRWIKKQLRFIMLGFFLLTNGVIMAEASLSGGPSGTRSSVVSLFLSLFLNKTLPGTEPDVIPVSLMTVTDINENVITNDSTYFIPLGVTRRLSVNLLPEDATDKNVVWTTSNPDVLDVYPGGYLEARSLGENVTVTVTPSNAQERLSFKVTVHEKLAPPTFSASLAKNEIDVGTTTRLNIELTELEKREYDPHKLTFTSSDETVATINEYGVIKGLSAGVTMIAVDGHTETYELTITDPLTPVILAEDIFLDIAETGYVGDKTPLLYSFDKENVTDQSITITTSNPAIATIIKEDDDYFIYGNRVAGLATITVYYNSDFLIKQTHTIIMENVLPTSMTVNANKTEGTAGSYITLKPTLMHSIVGKEYLSVTDQRVSYTSSDPSVASVGANNLSGRVVLKKAGNVTITVASVANPLVRTTIDLKVTPKLFINDNNYGDFKTFVRKAVGHFMLFAVNGFFGFWTFYLFLKEEQRLRNTIIFSLIIGFVSAALSEIIQVFVPGRTGAFTDVLIDFSGYLTTTLILGLIVYFVLKKQKIKVKKPPEKIETNV